MRAIISIFLVSVFLTGCSTYRRDIQICPQACRPVVDDQAGAADVKPLGKHTLPAMTIPEALQIAERYVADQKLDISKHFISSVRYHESGALTQTYISRGPCWQVTYELMQYADGGQYFILVYMDRKVGHIRGL